MAYVNKSPTCNKWDCAGFEDGNCICLEDNNFGNKECPFYKTKAQAEKEQAYCRDRMNQIRINMKEN